MAYDGDEDYNQLGMYCMINGVNVKISEKFKLPERISLPIGWQPSDLSELLCFEYDFWKENEVISQAEEERLIQAQMNNNLDEETNECIPAEGDDATEDEAREDEDSPNTSTDSTVTEILTPLVIPSEGVENKLDEIHQKINVEEFEDNNQNPFELVELQTLNEYDELRSVLEPNAKGRKIVKSKDESETNDNFELDANFFSNVEITTPLPTISNENYILNYSDDETNVSAPTERGRDAFNIPDGMSKGTLNWTKFNKDNPCYVGSNQPGQSIDQLTNTHINGPLTVSNDQNVGQLPISIHNGQNHAMMPHEVSSGHSNAMMSHSDSNLPNVPMLTEAPGHNENKQMPLNLSYGQMLFMTDVLPRTKSLPELEGKGEHSFNPGSEATPLPVNNFYTTDPSNPLRSIIDRSQVENVVSTDRIDSIMKQYQFQRLSNMPAATHYNPSGSGQISNLSGNMPQNVSIPGFAPNTISTNANIPPESFANPVPLPFSIQDGSAGAFNQANVNFNQVNHNPTPDVQNPPFVNTPTSTFQGAPANLSNALKINTKNSPTYHTDANPFTQTNIQNPKTSQVPTSIYRHGILPPLPIERSHLASNFNSTPSAFEPTYSMTAPSQLTETDLRGSQSPLLPNISPQETPAPVIPLHSNENGKSKVSPRAPQESIPLLIDPTEDLALNQKNFAYQVAAMGFPLPCVSRTVLRLGVDQKEVFDFLCSVQDLKDKNFHSDDVEMALVRLKDDKEKVAPYLEIVATLKELGFKPLEIHNALQETSIDQNQVIDYLTR